MAEDAAFPKRAYHLVWGPVAAFALAQLTLALTAPRGLPDLPYAPTKEVWRESWTPAMANWHEASLRLQFLALVLIFFVFSVGVVIKYQKDLAMFGPQGRAVLRRIAVTVLAVAGVAAVLFYVPIPSIGSSVLPGTSDIVGQKVFDDAIRASGGDRLWRPFTFSVIKWARQVLSALTLAALIAGGISCVARFRGLDECENWSVQSDRLRMNVYVNAGLLVVGILYMKALTSYPVFLFNEEGRQVYLRTVHSFAMFIGVQFSLMLAAYVVPVAVILSRRADTVARGVIARERHEAQEEARRPTHTEIRETREKLGLMVSVQDMLKSIIAILAPFLTGSIASLGSVLG